MAIHVPEAYHKNSVLSRGLNHVVTDNYYVRGSKSTGIGMSQVAKIPEVRWIVLSAMRM